jgi:hypothetical protein
MADLPLTEEGLKLLRVKVAAEFNDATAKQNNEAAAAAKQMLEAIDDALDDMAIANLGALATQLKELQAKIDEAKKKATLIGGLQDAVKQAAASHGVSGQDTAKEDDPKQPPDLPG